MVEHLLHNLIYYTPVYSCAHCKASERALLSQITTLLSMTTEQSSDIAIHGTFACIELTGMLRNYGYVIGTSQ